MQQYHPALVAYIIASAKERTAYEVLTSAQAVYDEARTNAQDAYDKALRREERQGGVR